MKLLLISLALLLVSTSAMRTRQADDCVEYNYNYDTAMGPCTSVSRYCQDGYSESMDCPAEYTRTK